MALWDRTSYSLGFMRELDEIYSKLHARAYADLLPIKDDLIAEIVYAKTQCNLDRLLAYDRVLTPDHSANSMNVLLVHMDRVGIRNPEEFITTQHLDSYEQIQIDLADHTFRNKKVRTNFWTVAFNNPDAVIQLVKATSRGVENLHDLEALVKDMKLLPSAVMDGAL